MFKLVQVLEEKESSFNGKIKVIKTLEGTGILVEGVSQSGWLVRKVWDKALKQIAEKKKEVEKILILGLGGGSAAKLVDKYWPGAMITGVDIDPVMVDLGRKYLGLSQVKNLKVVIEDAEKWVGKEKGKKKFNLILVDIYKGERPPSKFTTETFIKKVGDLLGSGGIAVFNHLYSAREKEEAALFGAKVRKVFPAATSIKPEANIIFIGYKE